MKKFILLSVALLGICISTTAKTWRVNNTDATANFSSLDDAMAGITAGDTLYLEGSPNTYTLSNPIMTKVAIIGPGYFLTENPNTHYTKNYANINNDVYILAEGVLFEGIAISSTSNSIINLYIGSNNTTVRRCFIGNEIQFSDKNNNTQLQINNTVITQCFIGKGGIGTSYSSVDKPYNAVVTNNIILNNSFSITYRPWIMGFYNSTIENNTFGELGGILSNVGCNIKNNISYSAFYMTNNTSCTISNNYTSGTIDYILATGASSDGQFQLAKTSGGLTAAANGGQCGAFGGVTPYVLSGLANIPHIYEIDAPSAASAASGLQVTLKIGTEK